MHLILFIFCPGRGVNWENINEQVEHFHSFIIFNLYWSLYISFIVIYIKKITYHMTIVNNCIYFKPKSILVFHICMISVNSCIYCKIKIHGSAQTKIMSNDIYYIYMKPFDLELFVGSGYPLLPEPNPTRSSDWRCIFLLRVGFLLLLLF